MEIDEVSDILGVFRGLRAPQHVFLTDETVKEQVDGHVYYRGLQPRARPDTIFVTRDGDASTPIHEAVHAQFNLGEAGTEAVTAFLLAKYRFLMTRPLLKSLVERRVHYQVCPGCAEFASAHQKYAGRVEHYVKA